MQKELLTYPDPALAQPAEPVEPGEFGSDWLRDLVVDMEETMAGRGIGLAATQIGVNKAVIIYTNKAGVIHPLCNPKIVARAGRSMSYGEKCLSVPGFHADIKRSKQIVVRAQTLDGVEITIRERGILAILLQHEIDHLNGMTSIDRVLDRDKEKQEYLISLKKEVDHG